MQKLKRLGVWYLLLSKRLLKKPLFLAVLALIPVLTLAMYAARGDSGAVTVALFAEAGTMPQAVADRLTADTGLLRCLRYDSETAAVDAVAHGDADAAWLLRKNLPESVTALAEGRRSAAGVTVVQREDTVLLSLAREKLFAMLYPEVKTAVCRTFLTRQLKAPEDAPLTLRDGDKDRNAIGFASPAGGDERPGDYLTAPLRGLLSVAVLLAGLASALCVAGETRADRYVWLPGASRRGVPLLAHMAALVPATAAALAALGLSGLWTGLWRELACGLLLALACAGFCELLRRLTRSEALLSVLIPPVALLTLLLCPVFLDLGLLRPLCRLLPPWYYLTAAGGGSLLPFVAYAAATWALALVIPARQW